MLDVARGTLVVYSDLHCPWAHAAVSRLHRVRSDLGLDAEVRLDHRAFPLEIFNDEPTPKLTHDAEIPVIGAIEPEAGWQLWTAPDFEYPVSTLLPLEAVQVAKEQGFDVSERLDRALRRAYFAESRCITMRHVVLDVARRCGGIDVDALAAGLDDGRGRRTVLDQCQRARADDVKGSPHVFAPDGTSAHNPGIKAHWEGDKDGGGYPVIHSDDPSVYERLLRAAAMPRQ